MTMPNRTHKYREKAVIEPVRVIEERKMIGLHPSCPVPAGAIMCYDAAFWQWVCARPDVVACDGWLKGAYLVPSGKCQILVLKVPGFGAPTAVMTLEELAALGIRTFVNLGTAGGLQAELSVGDLVICDRAIRDEGTSHHYVPFEKYAYSSTRLTENLCTAAERQSTQFLRGASWTTDAPYRETTEELRQYRSEGAVTVEMEVSALFAVGAFRGVSVSSVFVISDLLSEEDWNQGYHSTEKLEGLKMAFGIAVEAMASDGNESHC
jgi:uridine phosphorylase